MLSALCSCVPLGPAVVDAVLRTDWLHDVVKLLLEVKGEFESQLIAPCVEMLLGCCKC